MPGFLKGHWALPAGDLSIGTITASPGVVQQRHEVGAGKRESAAHPQPFLFSLQVPDKGLGQHK